MPKTKPSRREQADTEVLDLENYVEPEMCRCREYEGSDFIVYCAYCTARMDFGHRQSGDPQIPLAKKQGTRRQNQPSVPPTYVPSRVTPAKSWASIAKSAN
jgi:hypothetical protein